MVPKVRETAAAPRIDIRPTPLASPAVWNRVKGWSIRRRVIVAIAAVAAILLAYLVFSGVRAWLAWRSIDRFAFDLEAARTSLHTDASGLRDDEYIAYLVVGIDQRPPGDPTEQANVYADAILLWLDPAGGDPMLVSIPRDLWVTNPCDGTPTKLDATFAGCGDTVSGPELVSLSVEEFTGIAIDHFAVIRFEGLVGAIDGLGGIELCVPYALRNGPHDILPAGCSMATGDQALRYSRARTSQAFVDGEWRFEEGGEQLRNKRQQDVLLAMLARVKGVRAPAKIAEIVSSLGDALSLDDTLSMGTAIDLAWTLRSVPIASIRRISIPVESMVTPDGQFAVVPTKTFADLLAEG